MVVDARQALVALAALPVGQREDLALLIGGFSYREIAANDGVGRSVNNVNKHLTKARTGYAGWRRRQRSARRSIRCDQSGAPPARASAICLAAAWTDELACIAVRNASRWRPNRAVSLVALTVAVRGVS